MFRSIFTTLLFLLVVTCTSAQPARHQARGGHQILEELELTPEQSQQIKAIKQDARKQLAALRKTDEGFDREAAKAIHEQSRQALDAVLTPAQKAQLETLKAERKAAWQAVDKEGLKAALEAYRTENIEPVLRASRGKLDAFISAEDQLEIERLRDVFATRPQHAGKHGKPNAVAPGKADAERTSKREAAKAWRTAHAEDIAALQALAQKYVKELERVEKVLAASRETWKSDMMAIKLEYLPEGVAGKARGKRKGHQVRKGGRASGKTDHPKAGAFLLLRP